MSSEGMKVPEDLERAYDKTYEHRLNIGTWGDDFVRQLIERIAKAEAERDRMREALKRLSAPVSDEDCRAFERSYGEKLMLNYVECGLTAFLESRSQLLTGDGEVAKLEIEPNGKQ